MTETRIPKQMPRAQVQSFDGVGGTMKAPSYKVVSPPSEQFLAAKRGKIKGFSKHSRRRFRLLLLQNRPPENWEVFGCTYTVPGPPLSYEESRAVWKKYCESLKRLPLVLIWRMELQERGAIHWHAIMYTAPFDDPAWGFCGKDHPFCGMGFSRFAKALDRVSGEVEWKDQKCLRSELAGASHHMVDMQHQDYHHVNGAWLRYLQDHASKSKTAQVAVGAGRHWGVVNRKYLHEIEPDESMSLTPLEYNRFLRVYQRLCTPRFSAACVFGRRLGFRPRFGRTGTTVRFSRPETVKRIAVWAKGETCLSAASEDTNGSNE